MRVRVTLALLALAACCLLLAAPAGAQSELYDQYDYGPKPPEDTYTDSNTYCDEFYNCSDFVAADDFVVPENHTWLIERVGVQGLFTPSEPPARPALSVTFYENSSADKPGAQIYQDYIAPGPGGYSDIGGDVSIPINATQLRAGHYWIEVRAIVSRECVPDPAGGLCNYENHNDTFSWRPRTVSNSPAHIWDAGCPSWCEIGGSRNPRDLAFQLIGTYDLDPLPIPVGESTEHRLAVAPDGRAVFAWLRFNGANWILQARARSAAGALSAVRNISALEGDAANPHVAIDDQGDAVFTWVRATGTSKVVQARAQSAGGTLSGIDRLSTPSTDAADPRVDVDADGDAVIGWLRWNGSEWIAQAKARSAAGALSRAVTLSSAGADANHVGVAVDADGDTVFVWQRAGVIQAKRRTHTGAVTGVQNLAGPGASSPDVGIDDAGNAIFSWSRGYPSALYARRRAVDGTLSATQFVSASSGEVSGYPNAQLAVEADGDAVWVWESVTYSGDETYYALKARRRAANGTFSAVNSIAVGGTRPHIAVDAGGDAVITWMAATADGGVVRAKRRAQDGTLSPTQTLGFASQFPIPQVGVDATGNALFAWQRHNGTRHFIQGRHRAEGGALSALFTLGG